MYVGDMAEDMRVARATGLIPVGAAWLESTRPEILHDAGAIAVFSDPTAFAIWVGSQFHMDRRDNTPRPRRQIEGADVSLGSQSDCSTEDKMTDTLNDLIKSIVQGNRELVEANVNHAIDEGIPPNLILNDGLIAAMRDVGTLFEKGEYFLPEMLVSARAMQAGLSILKPLLVAGGVKSTGQIIMGTVKGDLHDIGKNLVSMMLEGAGFEVIDLGTDVSPQRFAEAVVEFEPQILGISALLTTTMEHMQMTIEALEDISVRDRVRVIIGGAPVTAEFAEQIGADGYAADASRAVSLVKHLLDVSPGG